MEIKNQLKQVQESNIFQEWKKQHPSAFLSFLFAEVGHRKDWQVGFYEEHNNMVTSFIPGQNVEMLPAEEAFRKPEVPVLKLAMDEVKIDLPEALEVAAALQKTKYPLEVPVKRIAILQHLDMGQVYNITYVTHTFKTLNLKVDAGTESVLQEKLVSLIQFPGK